MSIEELYEKETFTREEYYLSLQGERGELTEDALSYLLRKEVENGEIIHIGRDQYAFRNGKHVYEYDYSELASKVASDILKEYPDADFRIFELVQMNQFVNHQIAHNTVFVYVENDLVDYVFDTLRQDYQGRILLKPSVKEYYRYLVEDEIVILRLPSETPKGEGKPWRSRLEKVLVDICADKLLSNIISDSEYEEIYDEAFRRYYVDVKAMMRYARRKGAYDRYRKFLKTYAPDIVERT